MSFLGGGVMRYAFNSAVLVSIRNYIIGLVNALSYHATVDYHFKILPLPVTKRIVPQINEADIGANPVGFCVQKLV